MIEELLKEKKNCKIEIDRLKIALDKLTNENQSLKGELNSKHREYKDDDDADDDDDDDDDDDGGDDDSSSKIVPTGRVDRGADRGVTRESAGVDWQRALDQISQMELKLKEQSDTSGVRLRAAEAELAAANRQISDLRKLLADTQVNGDAMIDQLLSAPPSGFSAAAINSTTNNNVDFEINDMQKDQLTFMLISYKTRTEGIIKRLQEDKKLLQQQLQQLRNNIEQQQRNNNDNIQQMLSNKQLVEDALLERDKCLIREAHLKSELTRLQNVLDTQSRDVTLVKKNEISTLTSQHELQIEKLNDKITDLEGEIANLKNSNCTLERERSRLQEELAAILKNMVDEEGARRTSSEDLVLKLGSLERVRDEMGMKMGMMADKMEASEKEHQRTVRGLEEELNQVKARLQRTLNDLDLVIIERTKLVDECKGLREERDRMKDEKESALRRLSRQILILQQTMKTKDIEYASKMAAMEDEHRKMMLELNSHVSTNQRISIKLKEETDSIIKRLESSVSKLKSELTVERKRKMELMKLLRDSRDKNIETESKMASFSRHVRELEFKMAENSPRHHHNHHQHLHHNHHPHHRYHDCQLFKDRLNVMSDVANEGMKRRNDDDDDVVANESKLYD
ncbi:hypothetical protein HELRODRAFT_194693 [Helobdella robusta]|uniref:Uncharacterized protein n=1 Tax=Helobdella robusta TaxID=6412 RepID=T1FWB8_HELRO|nr:hypothetical protein HELRODRAFT_194693 [Helobdella robusta]ESN90075.1 hypothetical protein HELRODRAFT_194693 [Helobdella robusta]